MRFVAIASIFLSAFLAFSVEPLTAKRFLPAFGGTASVWVTCLVAFQGVLFLGYLYAHAVARLARKTQIGVHLGLLAVSFVVFPFRVPRPPSPEAVPLFGLLFEMARSAALPFFVLSTNSALVQHWYTRRTGKAPWFLYAVSNAGSLLGLLGYPLIVEPLTGLRAQSTLWLAGYALFVVCTGVVVVIAAGAASEAAPSSPAPPREQVVRWFTRSALGAMLLTAVSFWITMDVAAVPLLWVLPLALYLATFILAFSPRAPFPRESLVILAMLAIMLGLLNSMVNPRSIELVVGSGLGAVFIGGWIVHGDLSRDRPAPDRLTGYYLWIAAGGFAGGLVGNVVPPLLFDSIAEYPIALALLAIALAAATDTRPIRETLRGVPPVCVGIGMSYWAMGALMDTTSPRRWLKTALAGLAVGLGVADAVDVGAIFSVCVAAFLVYQSFTREGTLWKNVTLGVVRLGVVALFALFIAAQAVSVLVATNIKGVAGTQQDARTKEQRWDFATQWSLPKKEALTYLIPGLFGYRMDTPDGGNYWGAAGRDPAWDRYFEGVKKGKEVPQPASGMGGLRQTGGGGYSGLMVVIVGAWAALQALRKKDSVFGIANRKFIWFWSAVCVFSLLVAFGRHAPFYQLLYQLPYFSTIRNPSKFMHTLNWALVVLFAYGIHGLSRRYLESSTAALNGLSGHLKKWWAKAGGFDKKWTIGCVAFVAASLLGWLMYAASRGDVEKYLQTVGFDDGRFPKRITGFSLKEVGWYVLFLVPTLGVMILVLSGWFAGARARLGGILLGLLLLGDLGRANQPWINYVNYKQKNAANPVIDFLRQKPYEGRVTLFPLDSFLRLDRLPPDLMPLARQYEQLAALYRYEWMQHHFQYYNVQSLDIIQMPRMPEDLALYQGTVSRAGWRYWELTNTRYFLGPAALLPIFNQQPDSPMKQFRVVMQFDIAAKPGISNPTRYEELTAVASTNGQHALWEFTTALPRAKLFSNWQVPASAPDAAQTLNASTNELDIVKTIGTNDFLTLKKLISPSFDPQKTVLLAEPLAAASGTTNQNPGTVEFSSYSPKHIVLRAKAEAGSVLLLNDKFDPSWQVFVDGKQEKLLRCNYIMRGVYVGPGEHRVEFHFRPPIKMLYVSLAGIAVGLALLVLVALPQRLAAPKPGGGGRTAQA